MAIASKCRSRTTPEWCVAARITASSTASRNVSRPGDCHPPRTRSSSRSFSRHARTSRPGATPAWSRLVPSRTLRRVRARSPRGDRALAVCLSSDRGKRRNRDTAGCPAAAMNVSSPASARIQEPRRGKPARSRVRSNTSHPDALGGTQRGIEHVAPDAESIGALHERRRDRERFHARRARERDDELGNGRRARVPEQYRAPAPDRASLRMEVHRQVQRQHPGRRECGVSGRSASRTRRARPRRPPPSRRRSARWCCRRSTPRARPRPRPRWQATYANRPPPRSAPTQCATSASSTANADQYAPTATCESGVSGRPGR